mgnify:CR=1 FL=1
MLSSTPQALQLKGSPVILVVLVILVLPVISSRQGGKPSLLVSSLIDIGNVYGT